MFYFSFNKVNFKSTSNLNIYILINILFNNFIKYNTHKTIIINAICNITIEKNAKCNFEIYILFQTISNKLKNSFETNSQKNFNFNINNYNINNRNIKTTLYNNYFKASRSFSDFLHL